MNDLFEYLLAMQKGTGGGGGGGGGEKEWKPDYILHLSGQKFTETLAEIQSYGVAANKKVALYQGTNFALPMRLLTWAEVPGKIISITYVTDLSYYDNDYYIVEDGTNLPAIAVHDSAKNEIVEPLQLTYDGTTLAITQYNQAILYRFESN